METLASALAGTQDPIPVGAEIDDRLRSSRIPAAVLEPILHAVDDLALWRDNGQGVIVRSSATVEDSASHSFAGIFESVPITSPEELEPTIRDVWASVFSPRALTYFQQIGLEEVPTMAVVVQRFLPAERSGVMFTTFRGRTLVEHVEGDCEKLVKGEVTPEQLWLDGPSGPAESSGSLGPAHARELARLAATLEARFGGPQDVEWVLLNDEIHVVQSRPITTITAQPTEGTATLDAETVEPILTGIPASSGWGSGDVHLVFNIEDALALGSGQVLVTPMTNPDMVVAMRQSAAIVTDVGGMICHAAIVSRELGLPCVVGTGTATATLEAGEIVTVAGSAGAVYRGEPGLESNERRSGTWSDVWSAWIEATTDRPDLVPVVSSLDALEEMQNHLDAIVFVPDIDLRTGPTGLWVDLEGMTSDESGRLVEDYFTKVSHLAQGKETRRLYVLSRGRVPARAIAAAVRRLGPPLILHADDQEAPQIVVDAVRELPTGRVAVPLGTGALHLPAPAGPAIGGMDDAEAAALDTIKFFGHEPGRRQGPMPDHERRRGWWSILPEYARFHQEFATDAESGEFSWLEVRPELVISPLLKSLVQPGFEMVPRIMGFRDVPPMHIKWIRCRYHFRSDTFARVWQAIVAATWSTEYMADLMRRVRASYDQLEEVLVLFPETDDELAALAPDRIVALITSWWPRWVEFFALCWFIQAQGDDIVYPFVEETVGDNLARMSDQADFAWPGAMDLMAPTTPVLSGAYMADVAGLRQELDAAGLRTAEEAVAALDRGEHPQVARRVAEHLDKWHWMRDRDLFFEPWDTPARVIETALKTEPHAPAAYESNLRRNRLALSVHFDLAHASGRADGLNHAARFLHDLNVERENHHVLWLKFSYPLRRLFLEVERRFIALGSLEAGDVFFLQAPELVEATRSLPAPLAPDLVSTVRNRRRAFQHEARLSQVDPADLAQEDDYY
jgi:phosphohistidine swiveling domain-containing protein